MVHLVILCHGMWGNISHFTYLSQELDKRGIEELHSLTSVPLSWSGSPPNAIFYRARSNTGYFTYDGIDVCGTRVSSEIVSAIDSLEAAGVSVDSLSLMGYSMGGLMVRYAAGVLYTQGLFDKVAPGTMTTMFTPHLGVNVLGGQLSANIFNFIGSYSMARTSRQVFLRDANEKSGTPLFEHMLDPSTPYAKALALFTRKVLYANVVNDRRCEYYTAAVENVDPFHGRASQISGEFVPGYAPVVLSTVKAEFSEQTPPPPQRIPAWLNWPKRALVILYTALRVGFILPIWFVAFLFNVGYQTTLSSFRTRSMVQRGEHVPNYQIEDMLEDGADSLVERMYSAVSMDERLAFSSVQQRIYESFNKVKWEKHPVHISLDKHAHAAAIVRFANKSSFREGKLVIKHWIDEVLVPGLCPV
ncbi:hypothetical protein B9G98_02681 [Wickerhamiella sorbophila]|uniref:DUF676 domain-containing protein n=1 Tax=Wickerhamiella sorbophila TaxID=45607 RepID=A0A2T0FJ85_9ASCO|nr:hypothetical protein B9G98_02681 [Wickerhamiella sorbophila]PRT55061.1 hypothetical protein B9G98_02681 [Wickerhamiella sorbophila]